MYVRCPCGEKHRSEEVTALDIEEDPQGRDVLTFVCPVDGEEHKSWIYNE